MMTPSGPGYEEYAKRIGTSFVLQGRDGDLVPLVLTECTAAGPGSFSLIFKAGPRASAEQAIFNSATVPDASA